MSTFSYMKKIVLVVGLLCLVVSLWGQEPIRFGRQSVYLEANVQPKTRSGQQTSSLELGLPSGDRLNVLVQFSGALRHEALEKQGIKLHDYVGSNAYFATVKPGMRASDFAGTGLRSITAIKGEWKLADELLSDRIPDYAQEGENVLLSLFWFPTVDWAWVKDYLTSRKIAFSSGSDVFHNVQISLPKEQIQLLAAEEWVQTVALKDAPKELSNRWGARLHGAASLRRPYSEGGLGLTGKGVRVGVWDGNVAPHIDYGDRYHCNEFETSLISTGAHGMHVTGTIVGSGLIDDRGRGMAPEAEVWTNNFNVSSNGKVVAVEMFEVWDEHKISLTNNSYGLSYYRNCDAYEELSYSTYSSEPAIDLLCTEVPTLTHVFAAGNEGASCRRINNGGYGSITHRAKNPIYVGNMTHLASIELSSSKGPADDGRLFPTVTTRGNQVYSTVDPQFGKDEHPYTSMTGTSMACPTLTGHLALVTERFQQLNGGVIPTNNFLKALISNTARDEGRKGPDYDFGFGSVETQNAIKAMEQGWYKLDTIRFNEKGKEYEIQVPEGVKTFRVMIAWNDPVAIKQYAHGEKALINDLDLTVEASGQTVRAYALDPKDPQGLATKEGNHVDPIEQVEIENPTAGAYKVNVTADIRQGGRQGYTLTWYFDEAKPEILSPLPGEKYHPGEYILMNVKNTEGRNHNVELSYDGGKSYISLGAKTRHALLTVPEDAPITNNALLRITDEKSNVLIMQKPFVIMPQVQEVRIMESECSAEGWTLTWKPIAGVQSYNVLKGNIKKGEYKVIANVSQNLYDIPASEVDSTYTIFAVVGVGEGGFTGQRSTGVIAKTVLGQTLTEAQLPYEDTFVGYPLKRIQLEVGKNLKFERSETPPSAGFPKGSMLLGIQGQKSPKDWSKPFDNRDNVAAFKLCKLDLTGVDKTRKLFFTAYGVLKYDKQNTASQLRLVVNGEVVNNVIGQPAYLADNGDHSYAWDISKYAGTTVSLSLETALERVSNDCTLVSYEIAHEKEVYDVYANLINIVESKNNLGEETFSFNVTNNSSKAVQDLPVSVLVDGKLIYSRLIKNLAPFADEYIEVKHDFSTKSLDGQKFKVEIHAELEGDAVPNDNVKTFEVYNKGNVVLMPHSTRTQSYYGLTFPVEEKLTVDVDDPIRFTDFGGGLEDYPGKEFSTIFFRPADKGSVVQVAFEEYDLASVDSLCVWTNVDDINAVTSKPCTHVLRGRGSTLVMSSVSAGTVAVRMKKQTNTSKKRPGWKATVSQVTVPDLWALKGIEYQKLNKEQDENKITVDSLQIKVLVFGQQSGGITLYNVPVTVEVDGLPYYMEIPELKSEENTILLPQIFTFRRPYFKKLRVTLGFDGYTANNLKLYDLEKDVDPIKGTIKGPSNMYIDSMHVTGEKRVQTFYTTQLFHRLNTVIKFYLKSPNLLTCHLAYRERQILNGEEVGEKLLPLNELFPARLRIWFDFVTTEGKVFEDKAPEFYDIAVPQLHPNEFKPNGVKKTANEIYDESRPSKIDIPIDFTDFATKFPDVKLTDSMRCRMRVALFTDQNWERFKSGELDVPWGQAFDCTALFLDRENPVANDLQLLGFEGLSSGQHLGAQQQLTLKVRNNGLRPVKNYNIAVKLNKALFAQQNFTTELPAFGGEASVTFTDKVDMSKPGAYRFDAFLTDKDAVQANDTITERYYRYATPTDELYATRWEGNNKEWFQIPDLDKAKEIKASITVEGWWKLDEPQHVYLVNSAGFKVRALHKTQLGSDNALYFEFLDGTVFRTKRAVLKPGQWQHISLSVTRDYLSMITGKGLDVTCFVDGQSVEVEGGGQGEYKITYMILNQGLKGSMGFLRLWHGARSKEDVVKNRFQSVRLADGSLPKDCVLEYLFNEGVSNCVSSNQKWPGQLNTTRLIGNAGVTESNCVWQPLTELVSGVTSDVAVASSTWESGAQKSLKLTVGATTDWSKVKLNFQTAWAGTVITQDGKVVTPATPLDFSNNEHKLVFKARRDALFGKNLEQTFSLQLVPDASAECNLLQLSLLAADNEGLKADLVMENPEQTIVLYPENAAGKVFDASKAKFTINNLSEGATLLCRDQKAGKGGKVTIDLSTPQIVTVLAANQRDSRSYLLKFSLTQKITWSNEKISLTYSNQPLQLDAVSSSKLPCTYYTKDERVAVVNAKGELVTVGGGTTEVVAMQLGDVLYQAASEVSRIVEVSRVPLTVKMLPAQITQGDELPEWMFQYEGLVYPEQGQVFEIPYRVKLPDGTLWDESMPALEPGIYEVWPEGYVAPYEALGYTVTREVGQLKVTRPGTALTFAVRVTDEKDMAVENAMVVCGKTTYFTNAAGEAKVTVRQAGMYELLVQKAGYAQEMKRIEVSSNATVDVKLVALTLELSYVTDEKGLIQGQAKQLVAKGGSGSLVIAFPRPGFQFVQWSDGIKEAARRDTDVLESKTLTATFAPATYTLTYKVTVGGEFESGEPIQEGVVLGTQGKPVKVKAKKGYIFLGWSDKVTSAERTESDVRANMTFTAAFAPLYPLTYSQAFDGDEAEFKLWERPTNVDGHHWTKVLRKRFLASESSQKGYVMGFERGVGMKIPVELFSPRFSLSDRPAASVVQLSFTLLQEKLSEKNSAGENGIHTSVEYAINGGEWTELKNLDDIAAQKSTQTCQIEVAKLAGATSIQFRWLYRSMFTQQVDKVAIDDVVVSYNPSPATETVALEYLAANHGSIKVEGDPILYKEFFTTTLSGTEGVAIVPTPDEGYEFEKWSDDKKVNPRKDKAAVRVTATFVKKAVATEDAYYLCEPEGIIQGIPVQSVPIGKRTSIVVAKGKEGYAFLEWSDGVKTAARSDVMTADGINVKAKFTKEFVLKYTVAKKGTGLIDGGLTEQHVLAGKDGEEVVAKPAPHYHFVSWSDGSTTPERQEKNVVDNQMFTATFELDTYKVKLINEGEGEIQLKEIITKSSKDKNGNEVETREERDIAEEELARIPYGTRIKVIVVAPKPWAVSSILAFSGLNRQDISAAREYVVRANTSIVAKLERPQDKFIVTLEAVGEGTLEVEGYDEDMLREVEKGTELQVIATPKNEDYKLKSLKAGGKDILSSKVITVEGDVTVTAVFEKVSTPVESPVFTQVTVAPNPFDAQLVVKGTNGDLRAYELLDVTGKVVLSGAITSDEEVIETSMLKAGVYMLRLTAQNGATKTFKVAKH